jgi:outer membrane protein
MSKLKLSAFTAIVLSFVQMLPAQEMLTSEQALRIGLENNFSIRLVMQDARIADNNARLGVANFLPTIDINATQNYSVNNSKQKFLSGQTTDRTNAKSDAFNAGAQLNWTLFDGMRMFVNFDRIKEIQERSELVVLLTVEQTINNILVNYFNLIHLRQQLQVVEKTIDIDLERMKLASDMLEIGAGSRLELLQAEVDLNADSALLMQITDQITRAKINLNHLLARPANIEFEVPESFDVNALLIKPTIEEKMLAQNTSLQLSLQDETLAQLTLREIRGRHAPSIGFNMGYNFINQSSESGFMQSNRQSGITYGLNANLRLLDGLNTRRERQNADILLESSRIRTKSIISELKAELELNYSSYLNKLRLITMETQNLRAAAENLDIATERYRLGDLSGIEFREAQRNYMSAEARLLTVKLEAKILELNLLQLAGELPL